MATIHWSEPEQIPILGSDLADERNLKLLDKFVSRQCRHTLIMFIRNRSVPCNISIGCTSKDKLRGYTVTEGSERSYL